MPAMEWGMGTLPPAPGLGRLPLLTFRFWLCVLPPPDGPEPLGSSGSYKEAVPFGCSARFKRHPRGLPSPVPNSDRSHRLCGLGREGFCGSRGTSAELSPHWEVGVAQEGGSQVLRPLWQRRLLPPGGFRGQRVGANMPEGLPVSGTPPTSQTQSTAGHGAPAGCSPPALGRKRVVFPCCVTGGESGDLEVNMQAVRRAGDH